MNDQPRDDQTRHTDSPIGARYFCVHRRTIVRADFHELVVGDEVWLYHPDGTAADDGDLWKITDAPRPIDPEGWQWAGERVVGAGGTAPPQTPRPEYLRLARAIRDAVEKVVDGASVLVRSPTDEVQMTHGAYSFISERLTVVSRQQAVETQPPRAAVKPLPTLGPFSLWAAERVWYGSDVADARAVARARRPPISLSEIESRMPEPIRELMARKRVQLALYHLFPAGSTGTTREK